MFGSVYSKAVELFGKALLVSALLPLLAVTATLAFSIKPKGAMDVIKHWIAKEPADQASAALLLLAGLYLLSFLIFGMRERITRFLSAGEFWLFPSIRKQRRIRFAQMELDKKHDFEGPGVSVANSILWVRGGFGPIAREYLYLPPKANSEKIARDVDTMVAELRRSGVQQNLTAERFVALGELFVALRRLTYLNGLEGGIRIARLRSLCAQASPAIDISLWCDHVKALDYGDLTAAYNARVWSPPLEHIQPTELGNILIWAYSYTYKRYGIELDFLYPRLLKVIDKDYQAKIDDRQQFLDFTVILTFLLFAAATVYTLAAAISIIGNPMKHDWRPVLGAFVFIAGWVTLGRVAYGLSFVAARAYVSILTSAVDLFRLPLLEQLKLEVPPAAAEHELWSRLNTTIEKAELKLPAPAPEKATGFVAWLRGIGKAIAGKETL
jgi:hypothetical protein